MDILSARVLEVVVPPKRYTITTTTKVWEDGATSAECPDETKSHDEWRVVVRVEEEYGGKKLYTATFPTRAAAMKLQEGDIAYRF